MYVKYFQGQDYIDRSPSHTVLIRHYFPFDYKPSLTICINLLQRYQFMPPSAIHGKFNKNGRTLRLQRTRGRLEHIAPPYIESSYLYWPAIHRPSDWLHSGRLIASWWWCENCIVFSDCTHSVPNYYYSIISPPILVATSNQQKGGRNVE